MDVCVQIMFPDEHQDPSVESFRKAFVTKDGEGNLLFTSTMVLNRRPDMSRKVMDIVTENGILYVQEIEEGDAHLTDMEGNLSSPGSFLSSFHKSSLIAISGLSAPSLSATQLTQKDERIQELEAKLQFYEGTTIGGGVFPRVPVCEIPVSSVREKSEK
eukprot:768441-Hanusia_phi.AAC.16